MAARATHEPAQRLLNRELATLPNLDEFFMVRVAGLLDQAAAGSTVRLADGLSPRAALALTRARVLELTTHQSKLWRKTLCPALAAE